MSESDRALERQIARIMDEAIAAALDGQDVRARQLYLQFCQLHRSRSAQQVERMERRMGLRP
jgi:hypothetical protein